MKKLNNIPKSFIGFLIASFLIWMLINLSKPSSTIVNYTVSFVEMPQDKMLQEDPIKEVSLLVKGSGFKLLSAGLSNRNINVSAKNVQKKSANNFFLVTDNQRVEIQKQLVSGLSLQGVLQDTIFLKLGSLKSKKVPVVPSLDIAYKLGYNKSEDVKIIPDSVLISGPELQLKKVNSLQMAKLILREVSEDVTKKMPLVMSKEVDKVKMSFNEVELQIKVDKFTEGEFEIPVVVKNISSNKKINIFPKRVKVVFKVGLKDFNKITADSFKIVCNYEQVKENELTYLIPELEAKPSKVSSVRIIPSRIDFLIYK